MPPHTAEVFPNAVIHHDGVIKRITNQGEHRCQYRQINGNRKIANTPSTTMASWNKASNAPTASLNWKRTATYSIIMPRATPMASEFKYLIAHATDDADADGGIIASHVRLIQFGF